MGLGPPRIGFGTLSMGMEPPKQDPKDGVGDPQDGVRTPKMGLGTPLRDQRTPGWGQDPRNRDGDPL